MSEKTKRILAFIALAFMGVFTVSFVVFLVTRGNISAFITLFSGVIGIGLFFVIKTFSKKEKTSDDGSEDPGGKNATADTDGAETVNTDKPEENDES